MAFFLLPSLVLADTSYDLNVSVSAQVGSSTPPPTGGGGGGGGGGGPTLPPITSVTFSGLAYPGSRVTILKDGQVAVSTVASPDARFYIALTGLSSGNYIFSVRAEDLNNNKSVLFSFPMYITQGAITNISGIFLSPTIGVSKTQVKKGDDIPIFGFSVPNSTITITVNSEEEHLVTVQSDVQGAYLYNFNTNPLEFGQHATQSKSRVGGQVSAQSELVTFQVGDKNIEVKQLSKKADFNGDNKINIVDFSIVAYWYKRPNPPEQYDLNNDNKVDLIDFSIMAYYWTG